MWRNVRSKLENGQQHVLNVFEGFEVFWGQTITEKKMDSTKTPFC